MYRNLIRRARKVTALWLVIAILAGGVWPAAAVAEPVPGTEPGDGPPAETGSPAPADSGSPVWPAGSSLTATVIGDTYLTLEWTPASDDTGVTGYTVYRDGGVAATVGGDVYTYSVTGLAYGTAYNFKVEAGDAAGNWSADGPSAAVTTSGQILTDITGLTASTGADGTSAALSWTNPTVNFDHALVYRWNPARSGWDWITQVSGDSYGDIGLRPGMTYRYRVVAVDPAGTESAGLTVSVDLPGPPIGLSGFYLNNNGLAGPDSLRWFGITVNVYGANPITSIDYVYSQDSGAAWEPLSPLSSEGSLSHNNWGDYWERWVEWDLRTLPDGTYPVAAVVYDSAGNQATFPAAVTKDTTPPAEVSDLAVAPNGDNTALILTWTNPAADFHHAVVEKFVYYSDGINGYWSTLDSDFRGQTFTDTGVQPYKTYYYRVKTVDAAWNESVAPQVVSGSLTAAPITFRRWDLANNGYVTAGNAYSFYISGSFYAQQAVAAIYYDYSADGLAWADLGPSITSDYGLYHDTWSDYWNRQVYADLRALADGAYRFRATAADVGGNSLSVERFVYIDTTPPAELTGLTVTADTYSRALILNWASPGSDFDHGIVQRREFGGWWSTRHSWATGNSFADTSARAGVLYEYRVYAVDAAGNRSANPTIVSGVLPVSAPVLDYMSPEDGESVNEDSLWYDVRFVDDQEITSILVEVYTDGQDWTPINGSNSAPTQSNYYYRVFGNWGVSSVGEAVYQVRATATDVSGRSASVERTVTIDRLPPSAPSAFSARTVSNGVYLSWYPVDGAYRYSLERRFADPADGSGYSYWNLLSSVTGQTDTTALPGKMYEYKIRAQDAVGNWGPEVSALGEYFLGPSLTLEGGLTLATNVASYTLRGQTDPGAAVTVNGTAVPTDVYGAFSYTLDLTEGLNTLTVAATDSGGTHTRTQRVTLDSQAPAIQYFTPYDNGLLGGRQAQIYVRASDGSGSGVTRVAFEVSLDDGATWNEIGALPGDRLWYSWRGYWYGTFSWDTTVGVDVYGPLTDGVYKFRAVARDKAGNSSDGTPVRVWKIDNTAPSAPQSLQASAGVEKISLTWAANLETDLGSPAYRLYRSTTPGTGYVRVFSPYSASQEDTGVVTGVYYYYVVTAVDRVGNESPFSSEVGIQPLADTAPPVISSSDPSEGGTTGGSNPGISMRATDNSPRGVQSMLFEYSADDGGSWNVIGRASPWQDWWSGGWNGSVNWNTSGLTSAVYRVRFSAADYSGNTASVTRAVYMDVYVSPPENFVATPGEGIVALNWSAIPDNDFSYYEVLRSSGTGGFSVITTIWNRTATAFTDTSVQVGQSYNYKVRAADRFNNRAESAVSSATPADDQTPPTVTSVEPGEGTQTGGPQIYFRVRAADNKAVTVIDAVYSTDGGTTWQTMSGYRYGPYGPYSPGSYYYKDFYWNTSGLTGGPFKIRGKARDAKGNEGVLDVNWTLDLSVSAASYVRATGGEGGVTLAWDAIADTDTENWNWGSVYRVLRADSPEGQYSGRSGWLDFTRLSFTDTGLMPNTTYYYLVETRDRLGNTARSAPVAGALLPDTAPPTITSIDPPDGQTLGGNTQRAMYLVFQDNTGSGGARASIEYSADGLTWTPFGNSIYGPYYWDAGTFYFYSYWNLGPLTSGNYSVRYTVYDGSNNATQRTASFQVDRTPPAAPGNLIATYGSGTVSLSWETSDADTSYYKIYRATSPAGPFSYLTQAYGRNSTTRTDNTVQPGLTYYYRVTSVDSFGQEGDASNIAGAAAQSDTTAPSVTALSPAEGSVFGSDAWINAWAQDNLALSSITLQYSVTEGVYWIDVATVGTRDSAGFHWQTASLSGTVYVRAIARDSAGNTSDGTPIRSYVIDNQGPAQVTGVVYTPMNDRAVLNWDAVPDQDIAYYQVERKDTADGAFQSIGTTSGLSLTAWGLSPNATYWFRVVGYDHLGNRGTPSDEVAVVTDGVAPVVTGLEPADGSELGGTVSIAVQATDNAAVDSVTLQYSADGGVSWTTVGTVATAGPASFQWNTASLSGTVYVRAVARDSAGNTSDGTPIREYLIDNTGPSQVTGLAFSRNETSVSLVWAPVEDSDLDHYLVERKDSPGGAYQIIGSVTGATYAALGLTPNTGYWFRVAAYDRMGNRGPASGEVEVITDTTAPVVLGIEPADGTLLGPQAQITVRAEDNLALSGVTLQYSLTDSLSWVDIGTVRNQNIAYFQWNTAPVNGAVYVRAVARDSAGNSSDGSPVRTYTVDTQGPAQVTGVTYSLSSSDPSTALVLRWNDVPDQDFDFFQVERKDAPDGQYVSLGRISTTLGMNVTGLLPDTSYWLRVAAYDRFGNRGISSEEVAAATASDTAAPQVTGISPLPGYFAETIPLRGSAADNSGVAAFTFQFSVDGANWADLATMTPDGAPSTASVTYGWDVSGLAEGAYFVRGTARDAAGNTSSSSPVVEYRVDHTGPSQPGGFTLTASQTDITLAWAQGPEADLASYRLYKSSSAGGPYTVLADRISSLGYRDRALEPNTVYYYKVAAVDAAGNEGPSAGPVSGQLEADTTAPTIERFSPASGTTLGANPSFSVLAIDNYRLSQVTVEYQVYGDPAADWTLLGSQNLNVNGQWVTFNWDTAGLTGGVYSVRATATDLAGNVSQPQTAIYELNLQPPAAPVITAAPGGWRVDLSWSSGNEPDLAGFYLYRGTAPGGPYRLIRQFGPSGTNFADAPLGPDQIYYYVVDAIDIYRNSVRSAEVSVRPSADDPYPPTADAGDDQTVTLGMTAQFDGSLSRDNDRIARYHWDFGDGETATDANPTHAYASIGSYSVTLTVYDPWGNTATDTSTVEVHEPRQVGSLEVRVLDDVSGAPVSGASVVIQFPDGTMQKLTTNSLGLANAAAAPGEYRVFAYKTDYKPAAADATLAVGQNTRTTVRLQRGQLVVGELTVRRMTLDEIIEAGVDINAPENQWVYKFEVHLAFNNQPLPPSQFMVNGFGGFVGGAPAPLRISGGGGGGGGGGGTLLAYPVAIPHSRPEVRPTIAYLVIPGEARWLKEFFEVGLTLENTADPEFVIEGSRATLKLPDGLALAPTRVPQSLQVDLGSIAGQERREVKWIIRGDQKGYYTLEADFDGILQPFGDPVHSTFRTRDPFRVWGDDALKMHVDAQDQAAEGHPYHVRFGLENVSDVPVYMASIELLENGKQNYIYAPNQELVKTIRELSPGQTFWADYWLIPCINGQLDLSQSYVLKTGGNATVPTVITEHPMPENVPGTAPVLSQTQNADGTVTLSWGTVTGAAYYRIYSVRSDLNMSAAAERVYEAVADPSAAAQAVTLNQPGGPRDYVITSVLPEGEILRHAVINPSWCESTGAPVITVDPTQVYAGRSTELLITVNRNGFPVTGGTVDVGSFASGAVLDANGQTRVSVSPAQPGEISVTAYDRYRQRLVSTAVYAVEAPVDTSPPVWPPGSALTGSGIGQTSLTLNWTAATDDVGVTGYRVYQGSALVASVAGDVYTFTVTGLTAGTSYSFRVEAGDGAGNWSVGLSASFITFAPVAASGLTWMGSLNPTIPAQVPAGDTLPIQFAWTNNGVHIHDETVTIRIRNAATGTLIVGYTLGAGITIDDAAGTYLQNFNPARYNVQPGTRLKIMVYFGGRLKATAYAEVR